MIAIACGPFALWSTYIALQFWNWFAAPVLHVVSPPILPLYCFFAVVGFLRSGRYIKDGVFDWRDALTSSLLSPGLLLMTGYIVHIFAKFFGAALLQVLRYR